MIAKPIAPNTSRPAISEGAMLYMADGTEATLIICFNLELILDYRLGRQRGTCAPIRAMCSTRLWQAPVNKKRERH